MTLWTTNTWGAAHQNAAVFMKNLGPLVRAPQRVRRRRMKAVVIHIVYGATAKDGVIQPLDRHPPPLPSLPTPPNPLQGQCSTKFLSPLPFPCLSGPECIHVAIWGLYPWFEPSSSPLLPSPLPERRKRNKRVNSDPGILTCCYSRTQTPGFSQPPFLLPVPPLLSPGIQASWAQSPSFVLTAKLPVLESSYLGHPAIST